MILPDANLLLYAVNTDSVDHDNALKWWQKLIESGAAVGLYTGVVFAFVRLSTNRRVFERPLTTQEAFAYVHNWLDFPAVSLIDAELEDIATAEALLIAAGTAANLASDAQIAAAALRLNGTVHSAEADFGRFPKLKWVNPLDA
jgi:toxin-antitoxin system PIN domain toxin